MLGEVFVVVYTRVYNRTGPYLVGIALGCLLTEVRGRELRVPRAFLALGWLLSGATSLAVLFGVFGFYQRGHPYSALEAALYAGMHRTSWAAAVAWVVFACVSGHGGAVNALLSWKPFAPLARLSYCVYLVHYAVILVNHGLRRSPGYFSNYLVVSAGTKRRHLTHPGAGLDSKPPPICSHDILLILFFVCYRRFMGLWALYSYPSVSPWRYRSPTKCPS